MKKNKLSIFFTVLICICIFSVAAFSDYCGCRAISSSENEDITETEENTEEELSDEAESETSGEAPEKKATGEKETNENEDEEESEETTSEEEEEEESEGEAPTVILEIYEGPTYSSIDNLCYYRVKATVTGTPTPTIEWSKDDSSGAWGSKKAQVNLSDPSDTYTLTATATNPEGIATASINLSWGCAILNNPPEITDITLMGNHYVGLEYTVSASVTDLDGDSLTYSWSVTGGSLDNPNLDTVKWTMPDTAGNYSITLVVNDGNGGQDENTEITEVLAFPTLKLNQIPGGGIIEGGVVAIVYPVAMIGDTWDNRPARGFLNFDISCLTGKEVLSAEMKFEQFNTEGDPYSIIEKMWVESVYWGTDNIKPEDYDSSGYPLGEYDIPTFTCSSLELRNALNYAIDNGQDRFQIRLRHKGFQTDHDSNLDVIRYGGPYTVEFNVTYMP